MRHGISGNNKIIVLVNGMRVNPPGGENLPFRSDFSVRHAERVEVVYGSGSTLYGQDAISAVINIVTRGPDQSHQAQTVPEDGPLYFNTVAAAASDGGSHLELGADLGVNLEREVWGWHGGYLHGNENIKISTYFQYPWDVNLYALYRYRDGMDVFLNLRNITNHHYALGGFTGDAIPQETFNGVAGGG